MSSMNLETFFAHRRFLWLKLSSLGVLLAFLLYYLDTPIGPASGDTVLGYTLGVIALLLIFYLMWFGVRKRAYYSRHSTLKGCLSAHVWLGLSLLIIVPLHSGFQFGFNVHTLAYVLLVLTVLSGLLGAVVYLRYPQRVQSHRGGGSVKALLEQILSISREIDFLSRDRSDQFLTLLERVDFNYQPSIKAALWGELPPAVPSNEIAALLSRLPESESDEGYQLVSFVSKKQQLVEQIQRELRVLAAFRTWLYFHLPLSCALLAAVGIHVFSVFYYR